ncbi:T9SS type A sorting domain-containing protein [Flavobacterium beibuense]|uniref:Por secretion system C-terminal sorting domain containing protein n=1 Tax=Flavobacterium beibuense TaxID=657326 RepID=A0A444WH00_9FLAO|nr:T9SS type A sorting domain-containing protein [Flavobacterium beibuense]RYJ45140.1 Por secretion system C-terminal sorting domain containing protein [Flavobacterium beibuense]
MRTTTSLLLLFFISSLCFSQQAYITATDMIYTGSQWYTENYLYEINLNDLSLQEINTCNSNSYYSNAIKDIGIDSNNSIYYCKSTDFYVISINGNEYCESIYNTVYYPLNSLCVAGSSIYATGYTNNNAYMYQYNIELETFEVMGSLPNNIRPLGDLFFYENKLFLVCQETDSSFYEIYQINMQNVSESCPYMSFEDYLPEGYHPNGAFSINNGDSSTPYIVVYSTYLDNSTLHELDLQNKILYPQVMELPGKVEGAAALYDLFSTDAVCNSLDIPDTRQASNYINITNPVTNKIEIETNISQNDILESRLYDISGRIIRDFSSKSFDEFYVSGASSGTYILELKLSTGQRISKKIIIE